MKSVQRRIGSAEFDWRKIQAAKSELAEKLIHNKDTAVRNRALASKVRRLSPPADPFPSANVIGVGIGEKVSDGKQTGVIAVKLFVKTKFTKSEVSPEHMLPREVDGIPTDVEQAGVFHRLSRAGRPLIQTSATTTPNPKVKFRPAQPGCSIGFQDPQNQFTMAGTFGAVVKDDEGTFVLSNNHVLANENGLPIGSPIFQPGLLDGGKPSTDQIAALTRFISLQTTSKNTVDCAIAKVMEESAITRDILYIGPPQGMEFAALDMAVHKFGRTTGYTVGRITSIDTDVSVQYDLGDLTFSGQIIIVGNGSTPFSNAGDSGSLILERGSNKAVGLLFAGSASHTIANHIGDVLSELRVALA